MRGGGASVVDHQALDEAEHDLRDACADVKSWFIGDRDGERTADELRQCVDACIALHRRELSASEATRQRAEHERALAIAERNKACSGFAAVSDERDDVIAERDDAALEGARLREQLKARDKLLGRCVQVVAHEIASAEASPASFWPNRDRALQPLRQLLADIGALDEEAIGG